ncbi:hypothetical protein L2E82_29932 [Cichorium intybus]|uniref:Uncharacterized protein n=1 Tax=Cichorium intybus TaxID=13427 RepID=A0ACB9CZ53_CICIN|nr:hypothetical protein L2E82_29932 [Cichorium intybus]
MDKKKVAVPLVCHGHSRPVVKLFYSPITPDGFFLISASKDELRPTSIDKNQLGKLHKTKDNKVSQNNLTRDLKDMD